MNYVYWVIEGLLAGRPGPRLHPWQPEELVAGGIRAVVSLNDAEHRVEDLTPLGISHYRSDFPPVTLFSPGMQRAFIYKAMPVWSFIHKQLSQGAPTLVHCFAGQDRTGAVLAGYLVTYRGFAPEAALEQVRAVNPKAMGQTGYANVLDHLSPGKLPDPHALL